MNPVTLEKAYQEYVNNLGKFVPEGIIKVDLNFMHNLGLLEFSEETYLNFCGEEDTFVHNFYVVETSDKLTLFNEKFAVWIVPQKVKDQLVTYVMIAVNRKDKIDLDTVFSAEGIYNNSFLVLKVIEKLLEQIEDNEKEFFSFNEDL